VARVSARRYLEYFASRGLVEVALRYGTTGRPERQYRLVPRNGRGAVNGARPDMT
jgi:response regulator of citrate/malate metabolism